MSIKSFTVTVTVTAATALVAAGFFGTAYAGGKPQPTKNTDSTCQSLHPKPEVYSVAVSTGGCPVGGGAY